MEKKYEIGDRVIIRCTGKAAIVKKVVKAAYYCYYLSCNGNDIEGYFVDTDLKKQV